MIKSKEEGFSLLEISIALGIMGIMIAVTLPSVGVAMDSTRKAVAKSDVTNVSVSLQGWHLNHPNETPTTVEWTQMKYEVLEDYLATTELENKNKAYVDSISYKKKGSYYCVEATKIFDDGKEVKAYFDGAQGDSFIGTCSEAGY